MTLDKEQRDVQLAEGRTVKAEEREILTKLPTVRRMALNRMDALT